MNNNDGKVSVSIGFTGVLGIVFIVLKLTGVISWPWIWVLAPFWASIALALFFVTVSIVLRLIIRFFER